MDMMLFVKIAGFDGSSKLLEAGFLVFIHLFHLWFHALSIFSNRKIYHRLNPFTFSQFFMNNHLLYCL